MHRQLDHPMLSVSLLVVALVFGYVAVIALMLASTFAIVGLRPALAVENYRLRSPYKLFQDLLWLLFSCIGGYLVAWVATGANPLLAAALLAVIFIRTLWLNHGEAEQNGLIHVLVSSSCIVVGAVAGYAIEMRQH